MARWNTAKLLTETMIEDRVIEQVPRPHLGPSSMGNPCYRAIWYSFRWYVKRDIFPRLERLFNRGHREEPIIYADLKAIGIKILSTQERKTFAQGHGGSQHDGIILGVPDAPKTEHILEIKTANLNHFTKMLADHVQKSKPEHYIQMQMYMRLFKKKRALYIMVCKNDDRRHYERVLYNAKFSKELFRIAEMIIVARKAPKRISEDPESWFCRYCDFKKVCWKEQVPQHNCRTCRHSDVFPEAKWRCESKYSKFGNRDVSFKRQLKGCNKWEVIPG